MDFNSLYNKWAVGGKKVFVVFNDTEGINLDVSVSFMLKGPTPARL